MAKDELTTLTEHKVVRRGLLAGLATLGAAAMMKFSGASKAEAHDADDIWKGNSNTATAQTLLLANINTGYAFAALNKPSAAYTSEAGGLLGLTDKNNASGVFGIGEGTTGSGVKGQFQPVGGVGVMGVAGGTLGAPPVPGRGAGVFGLTSVSGAAALQALHWSNGTGVRGYSNASSDFTGLGTGSGIGVHGISGSGKGVYGQSTSSDGVHGTSTNGVGLRGTSPNFVGLVGISDQNIGLYGYTAAPDMPAFYAENLAPSGNRIAGYFNGNVQVGGNFTVLPGYAKNAAVTMPDGSDAVVYCQESPEPYFEDFGRARLVNGVAFVQLEPEFASMVKRDDYMVFPVPEAESKGHLFISQKSARGFEVREANDGKSNMPFSYRVVAKRKDIDGKRLARLDPQIKANLAKMRSASAARNHPSVKLPGGGNALVPLEPMQPTP